MKKLFLSSVEYPELEDIRECIEYQQQKINKKNCLWVKVDKQIIGQKYGFGAEDIHDLLLVGRFSNSELKKLNKFPIHVHVFLPTDLDNIEIVKPWKEMYNIGWACLYDNIEDAKNKKL